MTLICLIPLFKAEALHTALSRLHLDPEAAVLIVIGLIIGSLINGPVRRIKSQVQVPMLIPDFLGLGRMFPQRQRVTTETIIAVNVSGCLIPVGLVVREVSDCRSHCRVQPLTFSYVCHRVPVSVAGAGIMMPKFVSRWPRCV